MSKTVVSLAAVAVFALFLGFGIGMTINQEVYAQAEVMQPERWREIGRKRCPSDSDVTVIVHGKNRPEIRCHFSN